jgi:hypothetical protein
MHSIAAAATLALPQRRTAAASRASPVCRAAVSASGRVLDDAPVDAARADAPADAACWVQVRWRVRERCKTHTLASKKRFCG